MKSRTTSPAPAEAAASVLDPGELLGLREKARQGHHAVLARLHQGLTATGWRDLEEIPAAIDLRGTSPAAMRAIFEAETISDSNETSQCRAALAQLLEYRLDYGHPDDRVCVVVDAAPSPRRLEVLDRLGVAVVQADDHRLVALNEAGDPSPRRRRLAAAVSVRPTASEWAYEEFCPAAFAEPGCDGEHQGAMRVRRPGLPRGVGPSHAANMAIRPSSA